MRYKANEETDLLQNDMHTEDSHMMTLSKEDTAEEENLSITLFLGVLVAVVLGWYHFYGSKDRRDQPTNEERRAELLRARLKTLDSPTKQQLDNTTTIKSAVVTTTTHAKSKQISSTSDIRSVPTVTSSVDDKTIQPINQLKETKTETVDDLESSITPSTNSKTDIPTKKKRKFFKHPPPVQIICESLTWILQDFGLKITIETTHEEAHSWGGVGWWKTLSTTTTTTSSTQTVQLPLYQYYETSTDQELDWKVLCRIFSNLLDLAEPANEEPSFFSIPNYLRQSRKPSSLRTWAALYGRVETLQTGRSNLFGTAGNEWLQEFAILSKAIQQIVIQYLVTRLRPTLEETSLKAYALVEEEDLFSDDYDNTPTPSYQTPESPLDEFWDIVTNTNDHVIPISRLLADLFQMEPSFRGKVLGVALQELRDQQGIEHTNVYRHLNFLSQQSHILAPAWLEGLGLECQKLDTSDTGRQMEDQHLLLAPLLRLAASSLEGAQQDDCNWTRQLSKMSDFPSNVFRHSSEVSSCFQDFRQKHSQARSTIESWLKLALKKDKQLVFAWLQSLVIKSLPLASLAKSELLERGSSSKVMSCPSYALLLGLTASWIKLCGQTLDEKFQAKGASAFEAAFLTDAATDSLFASTVDYPLLGNRRESKEQKSSSYTGSTYFFFLACFLFRTGVHAGVKTEHEFYGKNKHSIESIRTHALQDQQSSNEQRVRLQPHQLKQMQPIVATWLGWKAFLEEPDFILLSTSFALLQLEWTLAALRSESKVFLPDWMVKDPARWLVEVAHRAPNLLMPSHAERAVECCTELLEVGNDAFSPVVVTCLMRIALAFVNASVNRARHKAQARQGRGWNSVEKETIEDRDLDIYSSFDKTDLGVTVFTNQLVATRLCPMLIRSFQSLDTTQVDMDVEYDFDKFRAKAEASELLLRLWSHPNGKCRQSIVTGVQLGDWGKFVMSCVSALSVYLDDAVEKLATTLTSIQKIQTLRDQRFVDFHSSAAASGFLGARRFLLLLCTLSEEKAIAVAFGSQQEASRDLANMFVHFIDILTSVDGGTNSDLQVGLQSSTFSLYQQSGEEFEEAKKAVRQSRAYCAQEIGLDVSETCHQFFALFARWHSQARDSDGTSPLLNALAGHVDIDIQRYQLIYQRLIAPWIIAKEDESYTSDAEFFFRDGFLPSADGSEEVEPLVRGGASEKRRKQAMIDRMSHGFADTKLSSRECIPGFLQDLSAVIDKGIQFAKQSGMVSVNEAEARILQTTTEISEEDYGQQLSDWVVSSSPFQNTRNGNIFQHYYDSTARSRSPPVSGKTMVKEARKCHKNLPQPHYNSSCFVCFAEERMDLCRAVVSGPTDTPYSLGLFVFDVYFPPEYPRVPPLMTFMTTGGGQVRFNPNLYVDGKVCLSLLGLTFAQDESQRWNADQSSLAQVLLSIQSQIFGVKEPYFNEGSGIPLERRNTPAGKESSRKHNSKLRLATLRHAIIEPLLSPPLGLEEVAKRHFSLCRRRLVAQVRRWVVEEEELASKSPIYDRLRKAYSQMVQLLASLDQGPSLPPSAEDVAFLSSRGEDQFVTPAHGKSLQSNVTDQDGTTGETSAVIPSNPWAFPLTAEAHSSPQQQQEEDSDEDLYS